MTQKIVQLAPMLGLIDAPFMNALAKIGGFDEMFMPYMVADDNSLPKASVLRRRFANVDKSIAIVPQLLGNSASAFVHFANTLFDAGYMKVNWNMGCPQPFVVRRNRGAAMLKEIHLTSRILEQAMPKLKPQLSVKIRLGYESKDEFPALIEMLNQFSLCEVIVHARTAVQQYEGEADRKCFVDVASKSANMVIYNGDIVKAGEVNAVDVPNLKGYMVGRGAIVNPFIGLQIKGESGASQIRFRQFCEEIQHWYLQNGTGNCLNRLKELWSFFSKSFVDSDEVFAKIKPIGNVNDFEKTVNVVFERYQLAIG